MAKNMWAIAKQVAIGLCVTAVAVASAVGLGLLVKHKNSGQNSCILRKSKPLYAEEIDMEGTRKDRDEIEDTFLKKCIEFSPGWQGNTNICGFAALSFIANMEGENPPIKGVDAMEERALEGLNLVGRLENETEEDKMKPVAERVANAIHYGVDFIEIQQFLTELFNIKSDFREDFEICIAKSNYLSERDALLAECKNLKEESTIAAWKRKYQGWHKEWHERIENGSYNKFRAALEDNYVIMLRGAHFTVVAGTFVDDDGETKLIQYQPLDNKTISSILIRNEDEFKKTYFDIDNQLVYQMMYVKKSGKVEKLKKK